MVLTFEKIREFQRAERDSQKLQKLPNNIMQEIRDYVQRKEQVKEKTSADVMELENVRNIIKDLFERREHKIFNLAIYYVRTGMPVENLTEQEEMLFYSIVNTLKNFRDKLYENLGTEKKQEKAEGKEESGRKAEKKEGVEGREKELTSPENKETKTELEKKISMVRIIKEIPDFVGTNLKIYKLNKNDIVSLPKEIEELLVKKGVAERIEG